MTINNECSDAYENGSARTSDESEYIDWQETAGDLGLDEYTDDEYSADPGSDGYYYGAAGGVGTFADPICPDGYESDGFGGCGYAEKLSGRVHGALANVVASIATGEVAGGSILNASAAVINSLTGPGYDPANLQDILEATQGLAKTVAKLECVLTKKLCCTLTSLCDCGQNPSGPTCCVLTAGVEDALADIVSSIGFQEDAAGQLILSGSNALDFVNKDASSPDDLPQIVLDALKDLASTSADVEAALEKKLCLSLGALTSCNPTISPDMRSALEDLVASVAVSEQGASKLVTTGADTLTETAATNDFAKIQSTMETVQDLTTSALRIEEVTMRKLCLALNALCGEDIQSQLDCNLDGVDCKNICTVSDQ